MCCCSKVIYDQLSPREQSGRESTSSILNVDYNEMPILIRYCPHDAAAAAAAAFCCITIKAGLSVTPDNGIMYSFVLRPLSFTQTVELVNQEQRSAGLM